MKLLVVGGVNVSIKSGEILDRSFKLILGEYRRYFDQLSYLGLDREISEIATGSAGDIDLFALPERKRSLLGNASYLINGNEVRKLVKEVIERERPDLIQIRIPGMFPFTAWPAIKASGIKTTVYIAGEWSSALAGNYRFPGVNWLGEYLDKKQHEIIRHSIPVSAGPVLAERYKSIATVHPYRSTTHREVYPREPSSQACRLLCVGRLEARKRIEDAISALELLRNRGLDASLTIAGDGDMMSSLRDHSRQLNLDDHVDFRGMVTSDEELHECYVNADILLHPSISEGTPKVLAEAMSRSVVPVAVTGVGSHDDIITPGVNGELVGEKDPAALFAVVRKMADEPEYYAQLATGAIEYARNHTLDREVAKLWEFVFAQIPEAAVRADVV